MPKISNVSAPTSLLGKVDASKLVSKLSSEAELEDLIYEKVDRLQALCSARTTLDSSDYTLPDTTVHHLSSMAEDYANELRDLLDRHFG